MTCCRDGTICFWSEVFKLQRSYVNAGQLHSERKKPHAPNPVNPTAFQGTSYRWIHDALYSESIQKVFMASDDHQITIYEGSTLERLIFLDLEKVNALTLDFYQLKDSTTSMLIYGTDTGVVSVFTFDEQKLLQLASRQKGVVESLYIEKDILSAKVKQIGSVWKRKAHNDWVLQVRYIPELKLIISCSAETKNSLSIAKYGNDHKWKYTNLAIVKGVNCFAYCPFPQTIATAGTDRKIRLWNPHRLDHPTSSLSGHKAPIMSLSINNLSGHLISLCASKHIKVWDIRSQSCLQTIINSSQQFPDNMLSSLMFNGDGGSIVSASNSIHQYPLKNTQLIQSLEKSHDFPVRKIAYNSVFKQIVSGCDGSVINVWDATSGTKTFKFAGAVASEITAVEFDLIGRRLITGSRGTFRL